MSSSFFEWREKRNRQLEQQGAKRRRQAARRKAPAPPSPPPPEEAVRISRKKLKVKDSSDLDSADVGELPVGTRVRVLERASLADGTIRAKISLDSADLKPMGWVSALSQGSSCATLLEVRAQKDGIAAQRAPSADIARWLESLGDSRRGTEEAWFAALDSEAFRVLRMKKTEDANTGKYTEEFAPGSYLCAACDRILYLSSHKFQASCGWASFSDSCGDGALNRVQTDHGHTELVCASCGGHVGHVYKSPFHPLPHHERHCANSLSLRFVPVSEPLTGEEAPHQDREEAVGEEGAPAAESALCA